VDNQSIPLLTLEHKELYTVHNGPWRSFSKNSLDILLSCSLDGVSLESRIERFHLDTLKRFHTLAYRSVNQSVDENQRFALARGPESCILGPSFGGSPGPARGAEI
jgi:hypothetical protein